MLVGDGDLCPEHRVTLLGERGLGLPCCGLDPLSDHPADEPSALCDGHASQIVADAVARDRGLVSPASRPAQRPRARLLRIAWKRSSLRLLRIPGLRRVTWLRLAKLHPGHGREFLN